MRPILIIEDDADINNVICEALGKAGYACVQAFSGTEGLLRAEREEFSLVILDLMLPGMKGEDVLTALRGGKAFGKEEASDKREVPGKGETGGSGEAGGKRETGDHESLGQSAPAKLQAGCPVMILSAKDSLDSKVDMLTAGAEDYMTKPFEIRELVARVGVLVRRAGQQRGAAHNLLRYGDMTLDKAAYSVSVGERAVELTRQEFQILELLMSRPDKVFSKQEIYDYAWQDYYIGEDKTVNVHISNIRKKLKAVTEKEYIETVWGIGFRMVR